jgi:hypothetical protein
MGASFGPLPEQAPPVWATVSTWLRTDCRPGYCFPKISLFVGEPVAQTSALNTPDSSPDSATYFVDAYVLHSAGSY